MGPCSAYSRWYILDIIPILRACGLDCRVAHGRIGLPAWAPISVSGTLLLPYRSSPHHASPEGPVAAPSHGTQAPETIPYLVSERQSHWTIWVYPFHALPLVAVTWTQKYVQHSPKTFNKNPKGHHVACCWDPASPEKIGTQPAAYT